MSRRGNTVLTKDSRQGGCGCIGNRLSYKESEPRQEEPSLPNKVYESPGSPFRPDWVALAPLAWAL